MVVSAIPVEPFWLVAEASNAKREILSLDSVNTKKE